MKSVQQLEAELTHVKAERDLLLTILNSMDWHFNVTRTIESVANEQELLRRMKFYA